MAPVRIAVNDVTAAVRMVAIRRSVPARATARPRVSAPPSTEPSRDAAEIAPGSAPRAYAQVATVSTRSRANAVPNFSPKMALFHSHVAALAASTPTVHNAAAPTTTPMPVATTGKSSSSRPTAMVIDTNGGSTVLSIGTSPAPNAVPSSRTLFWKISVLPDAESRKRW